MATVTFTKASRSYPGTTHPAVDSLDLEIDDGEFLVLVGPSGCGKSTTLRMLAGLEPVDSGNVSHRRHRRHDVAAARSRHRHGLPELRAVSAHDRRREHRLPPQDQADAQGRRSTQRVREAARLLDLDDFLNRKPAKLSGGQRQRVAMGRAIVRQPQVFLMDEPLSNLDAKLRVQTRTQIAALAATAGRHHRVRHPRPGRGDDDGRSSRRADATGSCSSARHPAICSPKPCQHLRRRVHRLAGDEHAAVHRHGRRADVRQPHAAARSRSSAPGSRPIRSRSASGQRRCESAAKDSRRRSSRSRSSDPTRSSTAHRMATTTCRWSPERTGSTRASPAPSCTSCPTTSTMHVFDTASGARLEG